MSCLNDFALSIQANSDDPPFLNVGTEVSAKYKGAFCEATIKIAKKLVKCKVSILARHLQLASQAGVLRLILGPAVLFQC